MYRSVRRTAGSTLVFIWLALARALLYLWSMSRIPALIFALVVCAAPAARADDTGDDADNKSAAAQPSHADPATKTLPTTASATAQANAFGQQGARMKAAHAAAKQAAANDAKNSAGQAMAASHRNSHASHAHGNANSHAANGIEHAAAHGHGPH